MFHSLYHRTAATVPPVGEPPEQAPEKVFLDWPVSYLDGFRPVNPETWQLEICGLVERPRVFKLQELAGFVRIQQNRRLVFADGWTYRATWEGFVVSELLHRVGPSVDAQYLIQTNLIGQQECMALKDLYSQRALFALRVEGSPLPPQYGGPLRLLVFDRYAHKGLGQLARLELSDKPIPGHFAAKGYDPDAWIEPGDYYASDLHAMHSIKTPGEITQW